MSAQGPDTTNKPGTPPSEIRVPTSTPDIGLFVHDALQEFSDTWGIAFDQVLIETSGINPSGSLDADMWWAMDGLDCTASVDYLIDAPAQWFELPTTLGLLPATVNAQPVALLAPLPEAHVVRTLLIELLDILSAANPAQEALDWWTDALATVCGRLHADPIPLGTLDGRMELCAVGRLWIGRLSVTGHRIALSHALASREPHDVVKVILQVAGTSVYDQRGEQVTLGPGDGLIYDVSVPHVVTSPGHTDHLVVILPRAVVVERGLRLDRLSAQTFSARAGIARLGATLVEQTLRELDDVAVSAAPDLAASIINLTLAPLTSAASGRAALRQRIQAYIRAHLREPTLSIDSLSRAFHCSKRTLHVAFDGEDQTIADFIRASRLEACRDALAAQPTRTVAEVAFEWGFASPAHFSRLFRRRFGHPPSETRDLGA